jgi:hypothetical protein
MFPWPANRIKPKVKATYTRKKILNPIHATKLGEALPTETENNINSSNDDGVSYDDTPSQHNMSGIDSQEDSTMAEENDESSPINGIKGDLEDSAVANKAAKRQLHQEAKSIDTVDPDDTSVNDDEEEVYEVEYFMADGLRKVCLTFCWRFSFQRPLVDNINVVQFPNTTAPQMALLTKWRGFELTKDLTWEPESVMRYVSDVGPVMIMYH